MTSWGDQMTSREYISHFSTTSANNEEEKWKALDLSLAVIYVPQ